MVDACAFFVNIVCMRILVVIFRTAVACCCDRIVVVYEFLHEIYGMLYVRGTERVDVKYVRYLVVCCVLHVRFHALNSSVRSLVLGYQTLPA